MRRLVYPIYLSLLLAFLLIPTLLLIPVSLGEGQFLEFPPRGLSLKWYAAFFGNESWTDAALLSLQVGFGATFISVIVGLMAWIFLKRTAFRGKTIIIGILVAPLVIPTIILALGLYLIFLRLNLVNNVAGLILAHSIIALPYSVMLISSALGRFDITIEKAARTLGAGPMRAFLAVTIP